MYRIRTQCATGIVREAAPMWQIDLPAMGMTHRSAPLSVTGTGQKSAFTTVGNPPFGPDVVTDARVRAAGQAAPPRGTLC